MQTLEHCFHCEWTLDRIGENIRKICLFISKVNLEEQKIAINKTRDTTKTLRVLNIKKTKKEKMQQFNVALQVNNFQKVSFVCHFI